MATIIRVAGADFSANPVGFMPPVAANLLAWHYLGGDLTNSARNLAPGGANATVVGSPTVETSHLRCSSTAYIQSTIEDESDCTLIAVAKMPSGFTFSTAAAGGWMVSAFGTNGTGMYLKKSGTAEPASVPRVVGYYSIAGTPTYQQVDAPTTTNVSANWHMFIGKFVGGTGATMTNKTTGQTNTVSSAEAKYNLSGNLFRFGASAGGVVDPIDMAFAAIYGRALTGTEETAVYLAVQAYLDRRFSITI